MQKNSTVKNILHIILNSVIMAEIQSIDNLRKFHNWIKFQLINQAKRETNGKYLLDVAVGRGGDIFKWAKNNIVYVTGIDNNQQSIHEKIEFDGAIKRYNIIKTQMRVPRCYFWNISATDPDVLNKLNIKDRNTIYDIVSCQFSFHYFVKEMDNWRCFYRNSIGRGLNF